MKRKIQDLKVGDTVWSQHSSQAPNEWKVDLISSSKLVLKQEREYDRIASRNKEDLTAFKFIGFRDFGKSDSYYDRIFYTEKLDALKAYRQTQDDDIEKVYAQQIDFLEKLKNLNEKIRNTDKLIAIELIKKSV